MLIAFSNEFAAYAASQTMPDDAVMSSSEVSSVSDSLAQERYDVFYDFVVLTYTDDWMTVCQIKSIS
ncbi:MAG: hypothetical protein K6F00_05270 [Lachnospiraceae bacterium]|nr:hypothetical protein [Lachnospiraceae bacterium]